MHSALALLLLLLPLAAAADGTSRPLAERRVAFAAALAAAERGEPGWERLARPLADHPLAGYLDHAALARRLPRAERAEVAAFLARHGTLPVAEALRRRFLVELDRRGDHEGVIALGEGLSDRESECLTLKARLARAEPLPWAEILDRLWRSPRSLPAACDPLLALHRRLGLRTPERIRERLRLAVEAGEAGLAAHLAGLLPEAERREALTLAEALQHPEALLARAERLGSGEDARRAVLIALPRLARRDPDRAEDLLAQLDRRFRFAEVERGPPLAAIALASALRFDPESEARFQRVPPAVRGPELAAWRVRALLAQGQLQAARAAIAEAPELVAEARFRYLEARLRELAGEEESARHAYRALAGESHWWGFLAAARLDEPAALCPRPSPSRRTAAALAARRPGLVRALELWHLGRRRWAEAEWRQLQGELLGVEERARAARLAAAAGWHRAAIAMLADPAAQGYYRLRFPLPYREPIERAARRARLDSALLLALVRAESAFDPQARSAAGAEGLTQLLPATAEATARRLGGSPGDWRAPPRNLELGALYLRALLDRYQDRIWLALAAYNAGPGAVDRWLARSAIADHPDLFIETIPFRETREYVPRVLAFAMLYRWRLEGRMPPATAWLAPAGELLPAFEPRCDGDGQGAGAR